jgi:hypothetical protein
LLTSFSAPDATAISGLTTNLQAYDKSFESLHKKISELQEQVDSLWSTSAPAKSSPLTDKLLEDISEKLDQLCKSEPDISAGLNDLKQSIQSIQFVPPLLPPPIVHHPSGHSEHSETSHPPPPTHPEQQSRHFSHGENPVASSQEEFIDTTMEADLTSYFESNSNLFKSEGGRLCASFGEQYKYNGSTSPSIPATIPPVLQALVDNVNTELCFEDYTP